MAAQQLQFEFGGGRISCPRDEAPEEKAPVCQVTAASDSAEPAVGVKMEEVDERQNLQRAMKRVCANQGSPGVDGMTVDQLKDHLRDHWPEIRQQLLEGRYTPQPVKQVLLPKPDGYAGDTHRGGPVDSAGPSSSSNPDVRSRILGS